MNEVKLKNKKVLVFGLGLLGGGVATTNWLLKHGALVTICDVKGGEELQPSLKKIKKFQGSTLKFELGRQTKKQIDANDMIVANPAVPVSHPLIQYALKSGKDVENEATLFFKYFSHSFGGIQGKPIIAVTGTRGKTTTTHWLNHFLQGKFHSSIAGNSTEYQFLKVIEWAKRLDIVAVEMPSFHLELFQRQRVAPQIAVITNLFKDHLNWHGSFKNYARAKANIFLHQKPGHILILNADNPGTKFFLGQRPQSHVWFFSKKPLAKNRNGVFYKNKTILYQFEGHAHSVLRLGNFVKEYGEHNLENLMATSLATFLAGVSGDIIQKRIKTLPQVPFRQEIVYKKKGLTIINDTTATSPEGGIAAMKRFKGPRTILITGGTDPAPILSADPRSAGGFGEASRQRKGRDWDGASSGLDYKEWAKLLPKYIQLKNVIFLSGSATEKMVKELRIKNKGSGIRVYETLKECIKGALKMASKMHESVILFSPSSKSFEKFKNEYDRGKQFNKLVRKLVSK